ncbi:alanine racemase [Gellertiella hungarica]|uniref:D-serine deaminase-like pyridoxal phosphate-dependent protein n=1 Tax=Gellertiella hungarica TaxID=1572859 RepID=A0A7W6NK53_9HYPH|nr:alanine racemase [Gellertiella hungarica]MBB4064194.1 D-serine deaminase-like pyridoxal phosphate-dependent protein [Gellertiella hungarica]
MTERYFNALSAALKSAGFFRPTLVIDRNRLDNNIDRMMRGIPSHAALRVVDKSLPSVPLLRHVLSRTGASRIMTFHLPITRAVLNAFTDVDLLFGKPMPAAAAEQALAQAEPALRTALEHRTVWLIDTPERLSAYASVAERQDITLRIAFEVDVGVCRGGVGTPEALEGLVKAARAHPRLRVEGLMAYEAHIAEIPALAGGPQAEQRRVVERFARFAACLKPEESRILNTGGSKTALLYDAALRGNDLSVGSAFVLPSDFDTPGLQGFEPAAFIATPVLKVTDAKVPGPPVLTRILSRAGLFPRRCCYIYGGAWMARPIHPPGIRENRIWGRSSNQQFMELPAEAHLQPDDMVFLRPTQSEAVLQQFGEIAVYADGQIVDTWAALPTG